MKLSVVKVLQIVFFICTFVQMSNKLKNQEEILSKLKIAKLNPMQEEAKFLIHSKQEIILSSPTGTGKTLAFLLPLMAEMDTALKEVQAIVIVPSRELAIQIEQVAREMGTGNRIEVVYGGRSFSKDKVNLQTRPGLLVGTPGRISAHLRRESISTENIITLVLDEFDKSLEIGFEEEMKEIVSLLPKVEKKILTSATPNIRIPDFVGLKNPVFIDYSEDELTGLKIKIVNSPEKDKLKTLSDLVRHIGAKQGIVFCNFKDSIKRISDFLDDEGIEHGYFYGNMEQIDRERALIKFRNGTNRILLATDLAARGLDIPEIDFIIHYHLPHKSHEFKHRNGRTARMLKDGIAYVLKWEEEDLPDFIAETETVNLGKKDILESSIWDTIFISGGRQDKISKGDIAGLFIKKGGLASEDLGMIELKKDCAFVAVKKSKSQSIISGLNNTRLKKKKVRIYKI